MEIFVADSLDEHYNLIVMKNVKKWFYLICGVDLLNMISWYFQSLPYRIVYGEL